MHTCTHAHMHPFIHESIHIASHLISSHRIASHCIPLHCMTLQYLALRYMFAMIIITIMHACIVYVDVKSMYSYISSWWRIIIHSALNDLKLSLVTCPFTAHFLSSSPWLVHVPSHCPAKLPHANMRPKALLWSCPWRHRNWRQRCLCKFRAHTKRPATRVISHSVACFGVQNMPTNRLRKDSPKICTRAANHYLPTGVQETLRKLSPNRNV